jgi:hypothetical protein
MEKIASHLIHAVPLAEATDPADVPDRRVA